jgi:hypothetical protein
MNSPVRNAFTINRLGLHGASFPFCLKSNIHEGFSSAWFCPVQVADIADLVENWSQPHLIVIDVQHYWEAASAEKRLLTLEEIAGKQGVVCRAYDPEVVGVGKDSLGRLVDGWSHDKFHLFDAPEMPDEDTLIEQYCACREFSPAGEWPLLPQLPSADVYLDSHDDCYLYLEAREPLLLNAVLRRMLHLYFARLMIQANGDMSQVSLSDVPKSVLDEVWRPGADLSILRDHSHAYADRISVGFSDKRYAFTELRTYRVVGWIDYSLREGTWSLTKAP